MSFFRYALFAMPYALSASIRSQGTNVPHYILRKCKKSVFWEPLEEH